MAQSYRSLSGALRELQRTAPRMAAEAMEVAAQDVLPAIRAATPRRSGQLAGQTTIKQTARGPVISNPLPYANTIHWGRLTNQGRPSPVTGRQFVWGTIARRTTQVEQTLAREIDRRLDQATGP